MRKGPADGGRKPNPALEMHAAAKEGDQAKVEQLLAQGADPNVQDHLKRTPLHLAAWGGHLVGGDTDYGVILSYCNVMVH